MHAGKLDLRGLRAPPQSPSHYPGVPTAFSFDVLTPEQSFVLCAHTEAELQVWLRQLASLVHHRADSASLTYGGLSAAVAETSASSRRTTDLSRSSSLRDSSIGPGAPALHLPSAASSRPPRFHGAGAPSTAADEGSRLSEGGRREEEAEDDEGFTITLGSRHEPLTMQVTSAFVYSSLQLLRPRLGGGAEAAEAGAGATAARQAGAEATAAEEAGAEGEAASGGDGAALQGALLCQGRFERGQRVLVVRSPVEIANETASSLELAMAPQLDGGTARAPELLPAHQARALPLALTEGGAEPAAWGVCLRPADWRTSGFGWGTLVPIDDDTAILACVPDGGAGGGAGGGGGGGGKVEGGGAQARWLACAAISTPELEQGASGAMAHERKSVRRSREKRCNELKGFGLPAAETLLKAWPCARRGGRLFAPGWLYLTQARAWRVHGVCTAPRLTRAEHALHALLAPRVHHACTALAPCTNRDTTRTPCTRLCFQGYLCFRSEMSSSDVMPLAEVEAFYTGTPLCRGDLGEIYGRYRGGLGLGLGLGWMHLRGECGLMEHHDPHPYPNPNPNPDLTLTLTCAGKVTSSRTMAAICAVGTRVPGASPGS